MIDYSPRDIYLAQSLFEELTGTIDLLFAGLQDGNEQATAITLSNLFKLNQEAKDNAKRIITGPVGLAY